MLKRHIGDEGHSNIYIYIKKKKRSDIGRGQDLCSLPVRLFEEERQASREKERELTVQKSSPALLS